MIYTKHNNQIIQLTRGKSYKPLPIGAIKISVVKDLKGYLPCEGQALSKTEYEELYKVIGDTFGSTATTFNLPDLRGRIPEGADDGTFGKYNNEQIQSHNHTSNAHSHTISDHSHTIGSHCHYVCNHTHSRQMELGYLGCRWVYASSIAGTYCQVCCISFCQQTTFAVTSNTTAATNANTGNSNFDNASITVCGTTSSNNSTGDSETRGKRIGMYYMIKVKEVE